MEKLPHIDISTKATISSATIYNWERLRTSSNGRLTKRANKILSTKKIKTSNYTKTKQANILLDYVANINAPIEDIIYTLCWLKLQANGIATMQHVITCMNQHKYNQIRIEIPSSIWQTKEDILGYVYQSLLPEGDRISTGQYYTNVAITQKIVQDLSIEKNESFYDPCCGSGAFLLAVKTDYPENLFGTDINPIAVMITQVNLLTKYSSHIFTPQIFCLDFLANSTSLFDDNKKLFSGKKFDYIYTNPPWGNDKKHKYNIEGISSKERASMFIVKAEKLLKDNGHLHFLLPTSLLKIQTHSDIRKFILTRTTIDTIRLFADKFDGVFTDYFSIKLYPHTTKQQNFTVFQNNKSNKIVFPVSSLQRYEIPLVDTNPIEASILRKVRNKAHDFLTHSKWALGIVTGNNKEKLLPTKSEQAEAVFTGKEILPYFIKEEKKYIIFNPSQFQQCAKEDYYRAPEKLIYRFIAKRPIVAYDNQQRLCLNSANILIPDVDTISVKSMVAFLNSSLYQYLYSSQFSDLKVLKGNLSTLPFPAISKDQDKRLSDLVDMILTQGINSKISEQIDSEINQIFELSQSECNLLKNQKYENSNKTNSNSA